MKKTHSFFNGIEFIKQIELMLEFQEERRHLKEELGLSEVEIDGYMECFAENFIDIRRTVDENC